MIKKILKNIFFLLLLSSYSSLFSEARSSLAFRSAAFIHTSDYFSDIYGAVEACYEVEASTRLYRHIDGWANFDWSCKHGKSNGFDNPTRVAIGNMSLGIKRLYYWPKGFAAYIGIGPSFSRVWVKNECLCSGSEYVSKFSFGGILKTGINLSINNRLFVDLFVDYLYQPVHFHITSDVSGFKTGIGIGIRM